MMNLKSLSFLVLPALVSLIGSTAHAQDTDEDLSTIVDAEVPRIVLHDIITSRVCIHESKLYSIGAKVLILGKPHECVNANPMSYAGGRDAKWDMKWVLFKG